jgi:hypothetical protein
LDGVFEKTEEIDDLLDILSGFGPPESASASTNDSSQRTKH